MFYRNLPSKKIRASTDDENQPSVWQDPKFVIGMAFLAVIVVILISILIRILANKVDILLQMYRLKNNPKNWDKSNEYN